MVSGDGGVKELAWTRLREPTVRVLRDEWADWCFSSSLKSAMVFTPLKLANATCQSFLPFFFFLALLFACGILVLPPGIKPTPQHWKLGVLTTGGQGSPSTLISERTMAPSKWLSYPQHSAVRTENWCLGLTQASLASFSGLSLGPL